ncbi:Cellulose binding domain-containing protein [Streptomyces sp. Ag82_O1-12]|uniref:cellulose-binding domain-containing protein n=1 Tax=unclassified Streptomyces TaxID=2593676 RepID=UPI000BCE223B|nr:MULTISPECIES: cellulose-binding domain-containing protein [unclassified Streptomyces]SMQ19787.1 Cellulose binding domain-containing protein [Streptomyces sp. Ag82_O1-12]SOD48827.1 Cellulose binding domain-containing protein [Streptomyces sp. Ag82_G6-1]
MPDLPTPQDATEAALFSECWDAVLAYADLCTSGSTAAAQLGREAFAYGIREARAADTGQVRGTARRPARLPRIPLLLTSVRTTAAAWEEQGQGHKLDPDLRLWLNSDKAARYTGPPLQRPLALRGLRDLQQADAELLWFTEVEALPLSVVARRLGLDPAGAAEELQQVRTLFRDRCHRNHLDTPMDARCRSYARLLDAVTRSSAAETPGDLSRHLATCVQCAEAAACLRLHGGALPGALAGGVIGWGGLAYLERRRRAAEVRLGAGRPGSADRAAGEPEDGEQKARVARNGLLVAAVLVSVLALGVSLMPFGDGGDDLGAPGADRQPVADPAPPLPSAPSLPPATSQPAERTTQGTKQPEKSGKPEDRNRHTEPQGTSSPTDRAEPDESGDPVCRVEYDLVNQWPDGFQATVTVTSAETLDSWRVAWSFRDGQKVGQMWDASVSQDGSRVTAAAADYNKSVPAGGDLAFGFLASWHGKNSPPYDFEVNGHACATGS